MISSTESKTFAKSKKLVKTDNWITKKPSGTLDKQKQAPFDNSDGACTIVCRIIRNFDEMKGEPKMLRIQQYRYYRYKEAIQFEPSGFSWY